MSLGFDQHPAGGKDRVAARLEIRMAFESFNAFRGSLDTNRFRETMKNWAEKNPTLVDPIEDTFDLPAERNSLVRAQVAQITHIASDAELSFYAFPINEVWASARDQVQSSTRVEGVVRVTTSTAILRQLIATLDGVLPRQPDADAGPTDNASEEG